MNQQIQKLGNSWDIRINPHSINYNDDSIVLFQKANNLAIPYDLGEYFTILNGTNEEYDDNFFQFYSLTQFMCVEDKLKGWSGLPDYSNIVNTLPDFQNYFVFADYCFHMFCYAIKLSPERSATNEVIVISGELYKKISNSFSEFLDLYFSESIELQLNI